VPPRLTPFGRVEVRSKVAPLPTTSAGTKGVQAAGAGGGAGDGDGGVGDGGVGVGVGVGAGAGGAGTGGVGAGGVGAGAAPTGKAASLPPPQPASVVTATPRPPCSSLRRRAFTESGFKLKNPCSIRRALHVSAKPATAQQSGIAFPAALFVVQTARIVLVSRCGGRASGACAAVQFRCWGHRPLRISAP
jgi:hypothetical protein